MTKKCPVNHAPKRIAALDVAHLFCRIFYAAGGKEEGREGHAAAEAYQGTLDACEHIASLPDYDAVLIAFDAPPYNRTKAYPEYKANRTPNPPEFIMQLTNLREKLSATGYVVLKCQGYEADDLLATVAKHTRQLKINLDILTNDKDLMALVGKGVIYRKAFDLDYCMGKQDVFEKFGVYPAQLPMVLALMGDSSDNIPGIKGLGVKGAAKIVAHYKNIDDLVLAAKDGLLMGATPKMNEAICSQVDQLQLSYALVELQENAPIGWDIYMDDDTMSDQEKDAQDAAEREAMTSKPEAVVETVPEIHREPMVGNDSLVSGALRRQAPEPEREAPVAIVRAESREIAPAGPGMDSIMLRPGMHLTRATYAIMKETARMSWDSGLHRKFGNQDAILLVILRGQEMGLPPATSLDAFHVISGKVCASAALILARAKQSQDCVWLELAEQTATSVTWKAKKKSSGLVVSLTYTLQEAKDDGLKWASGKKNLAAMIRKCGASHFCRAHFGETMLGLYSVAEMGEMEEDDHAA